MGNEQKRRGTTEGAGREIRVTDRRRVRPEDLDGTPSESAEANGVDPAGPEPTAEPSHSVEGDESATAREEAASHLDDLKRLKAEFENYRKRVLKEQKEVVERATSGLVARLLGVLDSFELAVAAAEGSREFERMLKGVEMVFGELKETLASEGLQQMDARGRPFDPNLHEAAVEVPGDEDGRLEVVEVLRPGYLLGERVLRPAMVKVARRSEGVRDVRDRENEENEDGPQE